jgi:hypothetical protein
MRRQRESVVGFSHVFGQGCLVCAGRHPLRTRPSTTRHPRRGGSTARRTADIGVAVASFYPTVQLNGTVGFDSVDIRQLWQLNSLQYMAGPSVKLPIFAGGRLRNTLELRKSEQVEAAIAYQKTVMQAWHEVVNALIAYQLEQQRRTQLKLQMEYSRQALTAARERYSDGSVTFSRCSMRSARCCRRASNT